MSSLLSKEIKMKRLLALSLVLVMALTALAACGGKGDKKGTESDVSELSQERGDSSELTSDGQTSGDTSTDSETSGDTSEDSADSATDSSEGNTSVDDADSSSPISEDSDASTGESSPEDSTAHESGDVDGSSASDDKGDELLGTWSMVSDGEEMALTFGADGIGKLTALGMSVDAFWYITDGKLSVETVYMGETDLLLENVQFEVKDDKLYLTDEEGTVALDKKEDLPEDDSTMETGDIDDALVGKWLSTEEGDGMDLTFMADGKGIITTLGVDLDMAWFAEDGRLTVYMVFDGSGEVLYNDEPYSISDDGSILTVSFYGTDEYYTRAEG